MDAMTLDLLKELTEAPGLPGYEEEIRKIVARRATGLARSATTGSAASSARSRERAAGRG